MSLNKENTKKPTKKKAKFDFEEVTKRNKNKLKTIKEKTLVKKWLDKKR